MPHSSGRPRPVERTTSSVAFVLLYCLRSDTVDHWSHSYPKDVSTVVAALLRTFNHTWERPVLLRIICHFFLTKCVEVSNVGLTGMCFCITLNEIYKTFIVGRKTFNLKVKLYKITANFWVKRPQKASKPESLNISWWITCRIPVISSGLGWPIIRGSENALWAATCALIESSYVNYSLR